MRRRRIQIRAEKGKEEDAERFYVRKGGGYKEVLCEERRRIKRGSL